MAKTTNVDAFKDNNFEGSAPKDIKVAKGLKEVAPGIAGTDSTLRMLKRLNIDPKDLVNDKYKSYGK